jgi:hypothetical protein
VEVVAGELPLERSGDLLVAARERQTASVRGGRSPKPQLQRGRLNEQESSTHGARRIVRASTPS